MLSHCFDRIQEILSKQFAVAAQHDLLMCKVKGIGITTLGSQKSQMDKIINRF